jgi:nuclear mRNA export protein PCID2/THP1
MARFQGQRRGFSRGRGRHGQVSFAHGSGRNNHNNHNASKAFKGALPHKHRSKGKPSTQKPNHKKPVPHDVFLLIGGLENDLENIVFGDPVAKHIDPPFAELEDDFSRLKTQCIQLATLVLHLENKLEAEERRPKKPHHPEPIAIGITKSLPSDHSKSDKIKTTTIKAPSITNTQIFAGGPLSIIFSSTPKSWSGRRVPSKIPKFQKSPITPGTAASASSPMSVEMASPSTTQLTPTLDRLLGELHEAIEKRDGDRIALDLQIEPPLAQAYLELAQELQRHYPWGKDQHLHTLCERVLPRSPDGSRNAWDSFGVHLLQYLQFIRDYAPQNLLKTNNDIKRLLKWVRQGPLPPLTAANSHSSSSVICLGDTNFGVLILPSVVYLSKLLARISLGLDKRPELLAQLLNEYSARHDEDIKEKVTFVEDAANTVREAFIKCLSDKSGPGGFGRNAAPQGKRIGIYKTGNLCLKLLFQCRKLSSATTMFVSIDAQSPLLSHYPASQRVTYLYYLGRYLFANNHFYRAQLALGAAYEQCHALALRHRQLILVYLIAANVCLGRFPSSKLLLRREAADLAKHFLPLCRLIASGDLSGFRDYLNLSSPHGQWFLQKRLLLQLRNRCESLVWRSLARRVFIEVGFPGGEDNKTPFLRLYLLQAAAQWLNQRGSRPALREAAANSPREHSSHVGNAQVQLETDIENCAPEVFDSEFAGIEDAIAETGFDIETGAYNEPSEQHRGPSGRSVSGAHQLKHETYPSIEEIKSIMASLIQQDLIQGFLTHNNPRFAIPGAKTRGALAVGFPSVWGVIKARKHSDEVPGWVKEDDTPNVFGDVSFGGLGGGGRVVNLSGARPVGAGAT